MSARDKLLENPLLFFACCAVAGYMLWPSIKAFTGVPDMPAGNHSGVKIWDPLGFISGAQAERQPLEPVPGADRQHRQYRQYAAPGDIGWNGHQRFFGVDGARHGCARDANPNDPDDLGCGWRRGAAPGEREMSYPHADADGRAEQHRRRYMREHGYGGE